MMRSKIIYVLFFFNLFSSKAQISGLINYQLMTKNENLGITKSQFKVYIVGSKSIELPIRANISNRQVNETSEIVVLKNKKQLFILKDFSNKKLLLSDYVDRTQYLINDSLQNFKWKITEEKRKIQNFFCAKATTQFRGRNYEAWYAESIPIQNGPWKFYGLPGLIVKVADDENKFVYELTGIDLKIKIDEKIIAVPKEFMKDVPVTHKQFMALYKKKVEDYAKLSKVVQMGENGSYSTVTIILPEKIEKY